MSDLGDSEPIWLRTPLMQLLLSRTPQESTLFMASTNSKFLRFDSVPAQNSTLVGFPRGDTKGLLPLVAHGNQ